MNYSSSGCKPEVAVVVKDHRKLLRLAMVFVALFLCGTMAYAQTDRMILDVKERTAKSYIRFMRERDIIIKDPSNQSYFIRFSLYSRTLSASLSRMGRHTCHCLFRVCTGRLHLLCDVS